MKSITIPTGFRLLPHVVFTLLFFVQSASTNAQQIVRQRKHHLLTPTGNASKYMSWMSNYYHDINKDDKQVPIEFTQCLIDVAGENGIAQIDEGKGVIIFHGKTSRTNSDNEGEEVMIYWPAGGYNAWNDKPLKVSMARKGSRCPRHCDLSYVKDGADYSTIEELQLAVEIDHNDARNMVHHYSQCYDISNKKFHVSWVYIDSETIYSMNNNPMRLVIARKKSLFKERLCTIMVPVDGSKMQLDRAIQKFDNSVFDTYKMRAPLPYQTKPAPAPCK